MSRLINALILLVLFISCSYDAPREWSKHVVPYRIAIMKSDRYATGFHLKYRGKTYIVTNKHVCDSNLRIYQHGFIQFGKYVGQIIRISDMHDLCLVTSDRNDGLELAEESAKPMDKITLIGYPRGLDKTIRQGRVVSYEHILAPWIMPGIEYRSMMIDTISYGGNSGSPVLNSEGKVVGVLYAGSRVYHTEAFVVPLEDLKLFLALYAK